MADVKQLKKIPYGISNFESIRTENYAYVDKTHFIEMLEKEYTKFQFLIRPRKFGKSLFLSTLFHYYDIGSKDKFSTLFGDLYIGKNPTGKRNSCFVLQFSFSGIDTTSVERFRISFNRNIEASIKEFFNHYEDFIDANIFQKVKLMLIDNSGNVGIEGVANFIFDIVQKNKSKLFVIIDEYDHFANDLIAQGTNLSVEQYKQLIWANGVVRDFYETLKDGTKNVVDKIFITGITPIMLDDVTSGFNIANNLSLKEKYNEILGFTKDEVERFRQEIGIEKSMIKVDFEYLYNGYLFHKEGKNKLYNSSMINYFFLELISEGEVKDLLDLNLKTDYGRIKMLLKKSSNLDKLNTIIETKAIKSDVIARFSIDKIHEPKNFISLLYYMGLITLDKNQETGRPILKIPNYSIKTMYWEYLENMILERNPKMLYDPDVIADGLEALAFEEQYVTFFDCFQKNFVANISNRDLENFSEKNIKFLLLSILFQTNLYLPISEIENSAGYTDIYLQRRNNLYKGIKTDWIWEIKYVKAKDKDDTELIESKKASAIEQLKRYKTSNLFKNRTDVRYLAVVFIGKKEYRMEELQ